MYVNEENESIIKHSTLDKKLTNAQKPELHLKTGRWIENLSVIILTVQKMPLNPPFPTKLLHPEINNEVQHLRAMEGKEAGVDHQLEASGKPVTPPELRCSN